jgi:beta-glucanase (GH16 family)
MKRKFCAVLACAGIALLLGGLLAATEPASLRLIEFSADATTARVSASSAQVTFKPQTNAPGGQLDVAVLPGKEHYPGISIKPQGAVWDLARFGHVDVRLTNTSAKAIAATVRVDDDADASRNPWNGEITTIKAGSTETIRVRFGYSWGRRGYALDAARIAKVQVYLGKSDVEQSVRIESIEAGGSTGEKPAVPPDRVLIKPKDGILLGLGSNIDLSKQVERRQADATIVAGDAGQSLHISFPRMASETGLLLKPAMGRWDFRDCTQVTVHARNVGKTPVTLRARLESAGGDSEWVSADAPAAPGAEQEIAIPFAGTSLWTGTPKSGPQFNSDAVTGVAIELPAADTERELLVDSIRAALSPAPHFPEWLGKRPPVEGKWTQTLNDNFDGTSVDSSHWDIYGENYWDKQSHFSKDNVIVGGGVVKLRFEKKRGHPNDDPKRKEGDYTTGFLTSFGKWTQRYGYFEARMKLPSAPGLWPAFWTMPDRGAGSAKRGSTGDGGMEFDIMEYLTRYGPNRYNIAMHWDGYGKDHKSIGSERIYLRPDKDGFITSGLLWEPGRLTFYCNGAKVAEWENPRVSNVPAHLMFTLPCGGWGGNDLDDSGLPDDFVIDWVRAWQRDDLAAAK